MKIWITDLLSSEGWSRLGRGKRKVGKSRGFCGRHRSGLKVEPSLDESTIPHWFKERSRGIISCEVDSSNPHKQTKIVFKPI